jgi:hypothetical protein
VISTDIKILAAVVTQRSKKAGTSPLILRHTSGGILKRIQEKDWFWLK